MKIAVIGAGIIGVTCAVRFCESFQSNEISITIFADKLSPDTTSDVSAGFWHPYCLDGCSDLLINKWGKDTYVRQIREAFSENGFDLGVQTLQAFVLDNKEHNTPFWSESVGGFNHLNMNHIESICAKDASSEFKSGYGFTTTTVTVDKYIPFYMKYLKSKGVKFVQKKLTKLKEFISENKEEEFDYIINCVGLGALEFCDDSNMCPVRGQVLRVDAPWVKNCIILEHEVTYILPLSDMVVLGGTQERDQFSLESNEDDCKGILERCCKLVPSLKNAKILKKQAGLRPLRKGGIRLEMEVVVVGEKKVCKVIHNYGHGGSGVTLCWGCANEVCDIIKRDINLRASSNL